MRTRAELKAMAKEQIRGQLGILYIWLVPYMQATMINFYNDVKDSYNYSAE